MTRLDLNSLPILLSVFLLCLFPQWGFAEKITRLDCRSGADALKLAKVGNLAEATVCYEALVSGIEQNRKQESATNLFNLALLYQKQGQFEKASEWYQKLLILKPSHRKALSNLGAVYVSMHKSDAAIPLLEQAATMSHCDTSVYFALGNAYSLRAKKDPEWWKAAAANFERSIKCSPESAYAHFNLGVARDNLKQKILAEQSFTTALRLDPNILGRPDVAQHFKVGKARLSDHP